MIIAVTFGIANHASVDLFSLARSVLGVGIFLGISSTIGNASCLLDPLATNFRSEFPVITMILIIMVLTAEITQLSGAHTVLGAFVAGILDRRIANPHPTAKTSSRAHHGAFMPVLSGLRDLSADLTILRNSILPGIDGGVSSLSRASENSRAPLNRQDRRPHIRQSIAVGSAMNARGSTEVIVASTAWRRAP